VENDATTLIARAQGAIARESWLEALDLAAQALAADPTRNEAASIVGIARQHLGGLGAAGGGLRDITVVVVDLFRSTAIAARLGPELMRELMLELYDVCIAAVSRYEGGVLKYTGDGVMAQFGYPVAHDDDARRAVLAALTVIDEIAAHNREWETRFGEALEVRIGIDSGAVAVGRVSAGPFAAEELAGDPPNVATRVQASADRMTVRVTAATHRLVDGWFETEPVGAVALRNFPEPVELHRVLGPTDAQTRSEARRRPGPPLLGRDAELERLAAAFARAARGERQVVTVTGEAGIGKSRLVEQIVGTATATGALHLVLVCSRLQGSSPLWPIASALARFFGVTREPVGDGDAQLLAISQRLAELPARRVALDAALPLLGALLGVCPAPDLQPEELRRQTFAAVVDLLRAMADGAALLLCVDDADAADPSTLELLGALLAGPAVAMLLVLTGRGPLPTLGAVDVELALDGLRASHAEALVRAVAPDVDREVLARVVERSGGVPFVLEEQARAVHELPTRPLGESGELSMFLAARLDELGPRLRRLVGEIAVAGEEVPLEIVRALSDIAGDELDGVVADLCGRRVLLRVRGPAGDAIAFRHALLCDAAYRSLLETRRTALHARVGDLLGELVPAASAQDVARHHELGHAREKAARCWLQAARGSADTGALAEAIGLYRRSLAAITHLAAGPDRDELELDVQFRLGNALSTALGYTAREAGDAFARAVALAEGLDDSTSIFGPLWGVWTYWFMLGEHAAATPLANRLLRIGRQAGLDPRFESTAATIVGYQRLYLGDFEGARDQLVLAGKHTDLEPLTGFPHDFRVISRCALAAVLRFVGDVEQSRLVADETAVMADALDPAAATSAYTKCWVACWLAWRAELDGDPAAAIELATPASKTAAHHGYATWIGASMAHIAIAQCSLGRFDEGLPVLEAVVDAWRGAGRDGAGRQRHPVLMTPYFAGRLIEAQVQSGALDGALERIDELLAETAGSGERFWDPQLRRLRARLRPPAPKPLAGAARSEARGPA
jgi:class 3 adenylate cyclase